MNTSSNFTARIALLCSILALFLASFAVYRGGARTAPPQAKAASKLSDEEYQAVEQLQAEMEARFKVGLNGQRDVVLAKLLFLQARRLHGDLTDAQWQSESEPLERELPRLEREGFQAGLASSAEVVQAHELLLRNAEIRNQP